MKHSAAILMLKELLEKLRVGKKQFKFKEQV